jgi:hypothetical protein
MDVHKIKTDSVGVLFCGRATTSERGFILMEYKYTTDDGSVLAHKDGDYLFSTLTLTISPVRPTEDNFVVSGSG